MFPPDSGVSLQGPDHLTFDLSDASRTSLSFYGKRPGPGMKLDKHSLQFSMDQTKHIGDVLEAYERLILDAMRGDHTPVHHVRWHRETMGSVGPTARNTTSGLALFTRLLGAQCHWF